MHIAYVTAAVLLPATVLAAPTSKSASDTPGFVRGAPVPTWVHLATDIPQTERTDPVVIRLADTQAFVGAVPAVTYQRALQVNDSSSLGVIGQYSIDYFSQYEKLLLHKVTILRGNQRLDRTNSVSIRPLQRETNIDNGMLGGATTLQLLLDDVRIGDTLSIVYTIEGSNPVFGKHWSSNFGWDSTAPVERKRLSILHPRNRPLLWRQLGDFQKDAIPPQIDTVNDMERIRFESEGLDAIEIEKSTPADFLAGRVFQLTEYQNWQEVAAWASDLFPPLPATPALKDLVAEFRKQPNPTAQTEAALHWVQNEIRYFSVSIGENSHRPQAPDVVLKKRYGDCKDKSYLLVSLLRELGIDAKPVLLSADAPKLPAKLLNSPTWFNHVIVQVTINGQLYYVDPTRTNQPEPLATMPSAFPGASALVVDKKSNALVILPERADVGPSFEHVEDIVLRDFNGSATLEAHDIFRGNYADGMRARINAMSANEQKKYLLSFYEKTYAGIKMNGAPQINDNSSENTLEMIGRYVLPKAVNHKDGFYSIDFDSQILAGSIGIPDKVVRNFPFELAGGNFHGRYRLRIHWPETLRVSDPENGETLNNPYFKIQDIYSFHGNVLDYLMDYRLKQAVIPAAEVPALQLEVKKLNPFVSNSMRVNESAITSSLMSSYGFRSLDNLRYANDAVRSMQAMQAENKEPSPESACSFIRDTLSPDLMVERDIRNFANELTRRLETKTKVKGVDQCRGELAFLAGNFELSNTLWTGNDRPEDSNPYTRNLAWSYFYTGDTKAALATMERYQLARGKREKLTNVTADIIDDIALLQRTKQPVTPDLLKIAGEFPDGPWPRPVLAMQVGLITPEQLIEKANTLPADAKHIALNTAWFYIGQSRLANNDLAGARQAFHWYLADGLIGSDLTFQAKIELQRLQVDNPRLEAGRAALRANQPAQAIAAWLPDAEAGDPDTQAALGALYLTGKVVPNGTQQGLVWLKSAAEKKQVYALLTLANAYDKGIDVEADKAQALRYFSEAAELGSAVARNELGDRYHRGDGVGEDMTKALQFFHAAADQGNADAMNTLGEMYRDGEGVKVDFSYAEFWFRRAIRQHHIRAIFNLGYAYENGQSVDKNVHQAFALYREAAEAGFTPAQYNLGCLYEAGVGVEKDEKMAFALYLKAAENGNANGTYGVGVMYENGTAVEKNLEKATAWFKKAADQGNPSAMVELGYLYSTYIDGGKNYTEANRLYEKAATFNNATAEFRLGRNYEFGRGFPVNKDLSLYWYLRAAEHGDSDAQFTVGQIYQQGRDVAQNLDLATKWYEKAVSQGNVDAQLYLGQMYLNGNGVALDIKKGVKILGDAAKGNNATAMYLLGLCYERGVGVEKNASMAEHFFLDSAKLGSITSQVQLAKWYQRHGNPNEAQKWFAIADEPRDLVQTQTLIDAYTRVNDYQRLEAIQLRALKLAEDQPSNDHEELIEQLKSTSLYYFFMSESKKGLPYAERLLSLVQAGDEKNTDQRIDALEINGNIYRDLFENDKAASFFLKALAVREQRSGAQSKDVAEGLSELGNFYTRVEQIDKAIDYHNKAYALRRALFGEKNSITAISMAALAENMVFMGRYAEAEKSLMEVNAIREKAGKKEQYKMINSMVLLGTVYDLTERYQQAQELLQRAVALRTELGGENDLWLSFILDNLGRVEIHLNQLDAADRSLKRALQLKSDALGAENFNLDSSYQYLGELYAKQHRYADAEQQFKHAWKLREASKGNDNSDVAESLQTLGSMYNEQGRYAEAEPLLQRALLIQNKVMGGTHPLTKITRNALAYNWRKTGREAAAADLEQQAQGH